MPPMTANVWIRPFLESDLDLLGQLNSDPEDEYGFYGYRDPGRLRRDFAENGFVGTDRGRLAVVVGEPGETGEFVGDVSWHRSQRGPTSHGWNIGIALLPQARGHGYGTAAQRLLAEYLLAHTLVNGVEAETEVGNLAERRSLEKAGFTHEGTVRGSCYRAGKWRDMASYSILRSDLDLG
jgi:RimJ/RimL family protein N-acetyltransferase